MTDSKILRTAADVTPLILEDVEYIFESWFADDDRIDWQDFIDRLAKRGDYGEPPYDFDSYDSPAINKIKRHVRTLQALA